MTRREILEMKFETAKKQSSLLLFLRLTFARFFK